MCNFINEFQVLKNNEYHIEITKARGEEFFCLNKPIETIKDWEAGRAAPTYPTLEKMAYEMYKRPVAVFHELAHLLYRTGGIDVRSETFFRKLKGDYSRIEVKCNRFAGEFLLPESQLLI